MQDVLQRLIDGNRWFAQGLARRADISIARRQQVRHEQRPFALVLDCADSRVPPEIVFDCGLGDLFVIRTAGHTVDQAVKESVLFGVQKLNIPLILVLGHARCGAVSLAVEEMQKARPAASWVVTQIAPAIEQCASEGQGLDEIVKTHVGMTVARLNDLLEPFSADVQVAGAYYDLDTGVVEMLSVS
jgi:carbonic anhydrase